MLSPGHNEIWRSCSHTWKVDLFIELPISDVEEDDGAAKGSGNNYISFPALATSRSYADIAYRHVALPLSETGNIQHQSHCWLKYFKSGGTMWHLNQNTLLDFPGKRTSLSSQRGGEASCHRSLYLWRSQTWRGLSTTGSFHITTIPIAHLFLEMVNALLWKSQIQPAALHYRGAARRLSLDHQETVPSLQVGRQIKFIFIVQFLKSHSRSNFPE